MVIFSAAGTVILQRPMTDPDEMQRAYSPRMLHILDAVGLTDVFHARWFVALLVLVSLSIIAASVQRFPNSWRYFARPYKSPDENFRRVLPTHAQIAVADEETGLVAAERAFHEMGWKTERIVQPESFSLFSERHRISEMAVYIVHASLLLIFLGGIVDALYGWRGFLMLPQGQQSAQVALRDGAHTGPCPLPYAASRRRRNLRRRLAQTLVVKAGGGRWRTGSSAQRDRRSTIRWSTTACVSIRPATAAPARSIN